MPDSPVKDKNYNLVTVLQQSLENAYRLETYVQDAQQDGDQELTEFFQKIQSNNQQAGEMARQMLAQRLQG